MPRFIQRLYPERIWAFSYKENAVYLTFDDGPIPGVTPWVLDKLKKYNAKATFFCIGENVKKYPALFERIIAEGHAVGNHTHNHLNGWKTDTSEYIANVEKAESILNDGIQMTDVKLQSPNNAKIGNRKSEIGNRKSLFRPPYGKITSNQAKALQEKGYKIIMWDVISYDYDATISEEECLQNVLKNIQPGSVVVFHDSLKAEKNLRYVLPKVLEFVGEKDFLAKAIF